MDIVNSIPSLTYLDCSANRRYEDDVPVESFVEKLTPDGPCLEIVLGGKYERKILSVLNATVFIFSETVQYDTLFLEFLTPEVSLTHSYVKNC